MKYYIVISIAVLLCGCTDRETQAQLARIEAQQKQLQESLKSQFPYEFHYVGKESNSSDLEVVIYRFNRLTGAADRIVRFQVVGRDMASVTRLNLLNGESAFYSEKLGQLRP